MTFQSEIIETDGTQQIILTGRLDSATSNAFERTLKNLFENPESLVMMDFSALDFVSSAGLRVVLMTAKRAKQTKSRLVLFNMQPQVKDVFEISGFLKILDVVDNRNAAVDLIHNS